MVQIVFNKLKEIIANNTDNVLGTEKIALETSLKDIGINSISFIKIVVEIESEYGFEFSDEDLNFDNEKFSTFGSFVNYIVERVEESKS